MKLPVRIALLFLTLGSTAFGQQPSDCHLEGSTYVGPNERIEFHSGLSILRKNCGFPFLDLRVEDEGVTHLTNHQGYAMSMESWSFSPAGSRSSEDHDTFWFAIVYFDDHGAMDDNDKIYTVVTEERDKILNDDSEFKVASDESGDWGGVDWLHVRTIKMSSPSQKITVNGQVSETYPKGIVLRVIYDSRHQAVYVIKTYNTQTWADGLSWANSLQVAP